MGRECLGNNKRRTMMQNVTRPRMMKFRMTGLRLTGRKMLWLSLATLLLVLVVSAGVAQAQESANYNLTVNSMAGGNYGGGTLSSASYQLTMSSGNLIHVSTSSPGFELCSGF